jgi:hypothetical protein
MLMTAFKHCVQAAAGALSCARHDGFCRPARSTTLCQKVVSLTVAALQPCGGRSRLQVHRATSSPPEAWHDAIAKLSIRHGTFVLARESSNVVLLRHLKLCGYLVSSPKANFRSAWHTL